MTEMEEELRPCTECGKPVLWGTRHAVCGHLAMTEARHSIDASHLINDLEYAVLARSQGLPGSAEKLSEAKQAIRTALGVAVPDGRQR